MIRGAVMVAAVAALAVGGVVVASTGRAPVSDLEYVIAEPGDSYFRIAADQGLSCTGTDLWAANGRAPLDPGTIVLIPPSCADINPTTTTPPNPTTTTSPTPTTTSPTSGVRFVETFDENTGLDRFNYNVWNRNGDAVGTVSADHDLACGDPATQRTVSASDPSSSFYVCRNHIMTAVGDWSGYSVGWFTPKQTFRSATRVSWDVNVTNLGGRQWWEVMIIPATFDSGFVGCEHCAVQSWLSPDPAHLPGYPDSAIVVGNGAFGSDINIRSGGQDRYTGWQKTCGQSWDWFELSGACQSKAIRLPFSIVDNGNSTVTVDYGGEFSETFPGSFPAEFVVIFKDHNYTPDKDGVPVGHTWHWDNIIIE